jgi:hypothetical protein
MNGLIGCGAAIQDQIRDFGNIFMTIRYQVE